MQEKRPNVEDYELFLNEVEKVLTAEGGYVNDPDDSGGETKFGISKRSYPNIDIKNLNREEAIAIYYRDFWVKPKINILPDELKGAIFSAGINLGSRRAIKILQSAVDTSPDGVIGNHSLKKISEIDVSLKGGFLFEWEKYYIELCERTPKNKKFLKGWKNRIKEYV